MSILLQLRNFDLEEQQSSKYQLICKINMLTYLLFSLYVFAAVKQKKNNCFSSLPVWTNFIIYVVMFFSMDYYMFMDQKLER